MKIIFKNSKNEIEEMEVTKVTKSHDQAGTLRYRVHYYIYNDIKSYFYIEAENMIKIIK